MPILALSTNASIRDWETSTTNVDLLVDGVPLTGVAAAAYLYGQALTTLSFERTEETVAGQTVLLIGNGVQLADARFQFPPAPAPAPGPDDRPWVSLTEVADALRYKYGVDPLIEFSPGLGSRGYSIPDINRILELLNREFAGQFSLPLIASAAVLAATQRTAAASGVAYNATAVATLLNTASTNLLTPATSAELHDNLTEGGDIYIDRNGAFYINGVRTRAMDLAVTSRVLVQENLSAEYKEMMDDLAERNNLIAAARTVTSSRLAGLPQTLSTLAQQYGMTDVLSKLTAGQYSDTQIPFIPSSTDLTADSVRFDTDPDWLKGAPVTVSNTAGGLTAGNDYYAFPVGGGVYRFYDTLANANAGLAAGRVNLTASIEAAVFPKPAVPSGQSGFQVTNISDFRQYTIAQNSSVRGFAQFSASGAYWETGDKIQVSVPITATFVFDGGFMGTVTQTVPVMQPGVDYFVRKLGDGSYAIFSTLAQARALTDNGRVYFDGSLSGKTIVAQDATYFPQDPNWRDGTAVRVAATGGGLTAGVDYYVRNLGMGNYSYFDSAANATATGSPRPSTGRLPISALFTATVERVVDFNRIDDAGFASLTALLNTLISNKVRDGDLDQAKLQSITGQLQNNTEAMTALIKAFSDLNASLVQALR